ncbi:MAG TPA: energy transducer TonB [Anaeromyxobacteraceae bacterium]|nr:energy transducer TonB [Anaeromyxobacteraceae bacterium]
MFDEVTKKEGGKNAARRAGFVFGSTAFQVGVVAAAIIAGQQIKAAVEEKTVDVKFVRPAAPPPPPPPPAAPPPPRKKDAAPRPPDAPKLAPPPPPTALIQPKDVQEEMKVNPNEPKEPEYDYGTTAAAGEGVVGGVVGAAAPSNTVEDAPAYATSGFVKPAEKEKGCVGRSVRIPRDLGGIITSVTVKFAVGRDGRPGLFEVMSDIPDKRIGEAIWQAIQSCQFTPGIDPRGQPQRLWMILPIRFVN